MRYASLAFRTQLSLLNSSGMKFDVVGRVIITVVRKCTVVGLDMLDSYRLSTGLRCSSKGSLSRRMVSPCSECIVSCKLRLKSYCGSDE